MGPLHYANRRRRTSKSPRRIQADGGGGGVYAAMLGRRAQQTFDATASVAQSIMAQDEAFGHYLIVDSVTPGQRNLYKHKNSHPNWANS